MPFGRGYALLWLRLWRRLCLGARILAPVTLRVFGFALPPFCKGYVPLRLRRRRLGLWGYFSIGYVVGC